MDPTQQKALNALEPYILLSKSANSPRAAIDLITQAISAPNTFVFAELLETPNIQALRSGPPEQASYVPLLELFAWGTWSDYTCSRLPSCGLPFSPNICGNCALMANAVVPEKLHKPPISLHSLRPKRRNSANSPCSLSAAPHRH